MRLPWDLVARRYREIIEDGASAPLIPIRQRRGREIPARIALPAAGCRFLGTVGVAQLPKPIAGHGHRYRACGYRYGATKTETGLRIPKRCCGNGYRATVCRYGAVISSPALRLAIRRYVWLGRPAARVAGRQARESPGTSDLRHAKRPRAPFRLRGGRRTDMGVFRR